MDQIQYSCSGEQCQGGFGLSCPDPLLVLLMDTTLSVNIDQHQDVISTTISPLYQCSGVFDLVYCINKAVKSVHHKSVTHIEVEWVC